MVGAGLNNYNAMITLVVCVSLIMAQATQSTNHPNEYFAPASTINPLGIWHDACQNTTGWTEQISGSGYDTEGVVSGTGGLNADTYSLTVPDIPVSSYNEFGPLFTKEFSNPIALSEILDFRVRISFENQFGVDGSLKIYLFDENKKSVFTMGISDLDSEQYDYSVIFRYSPIALSPWYIDNYNYEDDWNDYISYWYNDAIETPFILIGHSLDSFYRIPMNYGEIEVDRKVASIGISWTRDNLGEFDGIHLKLQEIRMVYRRPITPIRSWHHDCSNVTQFERVTEWSPTWWSDRILTMDNISSNGDAIYTPTYTSDADDWHGPAFLCKLPAPIPVNDIVRFDIQLEFLYSYNNIELRFDFYLFTEDIQPILRFYFSQLGFHFFGFNYGIQVFDSDLHSAELAPDHTISYSLNETFSLWLSTSAGFFADIPDSRRAFVGGPDPIHPDSDLFYFGFVPSSNEPESDVPVNIYDIHLDYVNESDLIRTNPGTTSGGESALFTWPTLDQLLLWGISLGSTAVILTFTIQTVRYRKQTGNHS